MNTSDMAATSASLVPTKAPGIESWPTIDEAAAQLQVSVRSIWRYKNEGAIQTRKRHRPGKKAENVCNPRDIARLLPSDVHVMPAAAKAITIRRPAPKSWEGALEKALEVFAARLVPAETTAIAAPERDTVQRVPIVTKLWLSLDEAVEYSGLARADLLVLCQAGKLVARKSRGWKIQRKSLEGFEG